jgi:hypothetical protein
MPAVNFADVPVTFLKKASIFLVYRLNLIIIIIFIVYVPSQQPQSQLETQHSVDKSVNNNNNNIIPFAKTSVW